ncbi:MAG: Lrp/AsnC family transcriptional regulator [Methanomassiliicoccales archaeon]|nr:Lrp/AsnC family transcriptional regulator [Methanomassiliicoccales archaeon]MDD1756677.1 Lrp/AsnC family transcriptional regulator [Methanomassiliicoccales archaeon]
MDLTDLNILKMLRQDSRESLGNIALKLGVSKATVSRRISKLEQEGYISGYTITTSSSKLGMMRAIIGLEVVGPAMGSVIDELRQFDEIEYVHKVFGDHSLLCEVYSKSVDLLYDLIQNRILKIPNIQNVEVDILIEKIPLNPNAELELMTLPASNPH